MMLRAADLVYPDSWFNILCALERGDHPRTADLASALRRGEPVPPKVQEYIARLLDGELNKRGTPNKWHDPFRLITLRRQVDKARSLFAEGRLDPKGLSPSQAALALIAKDYHIDIGTARKYYTKGGRLLKQFEQEGWPRLRLSVGPAASPLELSSGGGKK
jgi:hypothetical protein